MSRFRSRRWRLQKLELCRPCLFRRTDRMQFIQALGRKRLKSEEAVNVGAFVPSKQALKWQKTAYYKNALSVVQLMYAEQNPAFISYRSEAILTGTDLKLFRSLSHSLKSREYAYSDGLQKISSELYKCNPELPSPTSSTRKDFSPPVCLTSADVSVSAPQ